MVNAEVVAMLADVLQRMGGSNGPELAKYVKETYGKSPAKPTTARKAAKRTKAWKPAE